jgi:putative nucleotidyltransferase with HDIG domain
MNTLQALKLLQSETKAEVFLTGGFVRDYVRNKKSNNLDIVIRKVNINIIVNFLGKYGKCRTVKSDDIFTQKTILFRASNDNKEAQISLPRRGKTHIIDKNNTLRQDSKCRDFKINALYLPINFTSKKDVIDPSGGLNDIKLRIISHTASHFYKGSPVRILRAISLSAKTGYKINKNLIRVIRENKYLFTWISADNIRKELNKILLSNKPSIYLRLMQRIGVLIYVMPELNRCVNVKQDSRYHKYDVFTHNIFTCDNIEPDLVLRLAAVLHDIGKPDTRKIIKGRVTFHKHEIASVKRALAFLNRLRYDGKTKEAVLGLIRMHMYHYTREFTDPAVKRFIKRAGINKENVKNLSELPLFKLRAAERLGNGLKKNPVTPKQISFEKRIKKMFDGGFEEKINIDINKRIITDTFNIPAGKEVDNILNYLTDRVTRNKKLNNRIDLIQITLQYIKNKKYLNKVL